MIVDIFDVLSRVLALLILLSVLAWGWVSLLRDREFPDLKVIRWLLIVALALLLGVTTSFLFELIVKAL